MLRISFLILWTGAYSFLTLIVERLDFLLFAEVG
jgi:hypothetical protein